MKNKYHILWIDDEWKKMDSFIDLCSFQYNIELEPFTTQKAGLDAFAQNPTFYEGIILDAKLLDEDENEVADIASLYKAVTKLQTEFKDVPFFISTGQPDLLDARHFESYCRSTYNHRYYEKGDDDEELCSDIIKTIEGKNQRKIMNKYPEIFSWLPKEMYGEIFNLLTIIENGDTKNTNVFNNVRKILDWVMSELNSYGILAIKFNGTNLNDCSRFLCNDDLQDFVPQYMQRQIHSCCTIANEGSHRLVTDGDVRTGAAPFLIRSTVFELLNILMWMHQLPKDDETKRKITDIANNIKKDELSVQEEPQEPQYDEELKVWHCGDTMLAIKSWEGGKVYVFNKQENTLKNQKIKERYPFYAKYKKIKS